MKRLLLLALLAGCSTLSFAQAILANATPANGTPKNEFKVWFRAGAGFDFVSVSDEMSRSKGISPRGVTWFKPEIGFTIFKYGTIDLGAGFGKYQDYDSFSQNVVYPINQGTSTGASVSSKAFALDWYYKVGGRIPILKWLHTEIGVGHRFFNITREIPNCIDCDEETVYKKANMFADLKICFDTKKNMTFYIGYAKFLPKIVVQNEFEPTEVFTYPSDIRNCITLGFYAELRD